MNKTFIIILALVLNIFAVAASKGEGHHGSLFDLKYPLLNFVIFMGILIWAVKPKMKAYFSNLNTSIQDLMERASKKAQESALLLAEQEGKLSNLDSEVEKLSKTIKDKTIEFEKFYENETAEKISKLELDATHKIETERKQEVDKLSSELLDQVISQAKANISNNNQREIVADKLVKEIQL